MVSSEKRAARIYRSSPFFSVFASAEMSLFAEAAGNSRARPSIPVRVNALRWWHLSSLDAPTVAALWMWFVARVFGVLLRWQEAAAMFAAVWVVYTVDRLWDARVLDGKGSEAGSRNAIAFTSGIGGLSNVGLRVPACSLPRCCHPCPE